MAQRIDQQPDLQAHLLHDIFGLTQGIYARLSAILIGKHGELTPEISLEVAQIMESVGTLTSIERRLRENDLTPKKRVTSVHSLVVAMDWALQM